MAAAARLLEGQHDFAAFQAAGGHAQTTEREVFSSRVHKLSTTEGTEDTKGQIQFDLRVPRGGELIIYEITGNGFLRYMVRGIVGTLVEIGRGRHPPRWVSEAVASRDRASAGPTAPPEGLFLVGVAYPR